MLQFDSSDDVGEFRKSFKEWLILNLPERSNKDASLDTLTKVGRAWQAKLAASRWLGVHWPEQYGGRGLSLVHEAVIQEELVKVGSPQLLGLFGLSMVGPILIQYGTPEQQQRYLESILSGREIWCQGFPETSAGSDLAALRTRAKAATLNGVEGFEVTGHKVWTSFAHVADWCFLLCKSIDGASKYDGFSYLLVDMRSPGITVRPLTQISGEPEFNEVYCDNVFVPKSNLIGKEGDGWKIAISTLMYERVILTFARQLQSETLLREELKSRLDNDSLVGKEVGEINTLKSKFASQIASLCACRALAYKHLQEYAAGKRPGPEGSLDKLSWTESFQGLCRFVLELDQERAMISEEENSNVLRYLYSRGRSIAAGTSEIQRNIIAERILGMPKAR